nr:MAG TPA: hypothetical protein [Caudoviricetes sp.]
MKYFELFIQIVEYNVNFVNKKRPHFIAVFN